MLPNELVNTFIKLKKDRGLLDTNLISDGYHTFGELYEHRIELFITLCRVMEHHGSFYRTWKSKNYSDGTPVEAGWFLMGIGGQAGLQITYHIPIERWDDTNFTMAVTTPVKYDGHTSKDVLERLKKITR